MVTKCLSFVAWLTIFSALAFARLPNNKGGDWGKKLRRIVMEKCVQIVAELRDKSEDDEDEETEEEDQADGGPYSH